MMLPSALRDRRRRASAGRTAVTALARKPASFISVLCVFSAFSTHFAYSGPDMNVVLNAPSSMNFFQSAVSRTFLKRST